MKEGKEIEEGGERKQDRGEKGRRNNWMKGEEEMEEGKEEENRREEERKEQTIG